MYEGACSSIHPRSPHCGVATMRGHPRQIWEPLAGHSSDLAEEITSSLQSWPRYGTRPGVLPVAANAADTLRPPGWDVRALTATGDHPF